MKKPAATLLPCLLAAASICAARAGDEAPGKQPQQEPDLALSSGGDSLLGSIIGWEKAGPRWETAYGQPVAMRMKYLKEILFRPRKMPEHAVLPLNDAVLANGDVLPGVLVSFDGKAFLLDTWYAGRLAIPRAMVKSITASAVIYNGPAGLDSDGWVRDSAAQANGNNWNFHDGVLSGTGPGATVGRDLKLPACARIQFDLTLTGGSGSIYFCADRPSNPGSFYVFQVDAGFASIGLSHYSRDTTITNLGERVTLDGKTPPAMEPGVLELNGWHGPPIFSGWPPDPPGKVHFDIRIDKPAKTVTLFANGKMVRHYDLTDDPAEMGGCLIFCADGQGSSLSVGRIQVGAWSGGRGEDAAGGAAPAGDTIEIANRGPVHGKLKSIDNGQLAVATPQGDIAIPLPEVLSIRLSADGAAPPEPGANDVRVQFAAHGRATMEIESWDAKGVTATSPDFGRAVFSPAIFKRLLFNPGPPGPPPAGGISTAAADGDDDDSQ